jgi:hypothetical protein
VRCYVISATAIFTITIREGKVSIQSYVDTCAYSFLTMLSLSGRGSCITKDFFPPIDVSQGDWEIGLIDLMTFHSIPNIEAGKNNEFYYGDKSIAIDEGAYEIEDLETALKAKVGSDVELELKANNNTLKSEIKCSQRIDFTKPGTLASLLGFDNKVLDAGIKHISDRTVSIINVNVIRVECNIVRGSYDNGREGHVIHEFYPNVGPGYKIVETPNTIIYLPVNVRRISNITVTLKDQNGDRINLRNENISIRLHMREKNGSGI